MSRRFLKVAATAGKTSAALTMICTPVAALAQTIANQGVADRARPDYDPLGIQSGGITFFPSVTASADATDNYLATSNNRRGDVYATVQPEISVRSNWARHRLDARAYVAPSFHANLPDEDVTQFGVSSSGVYDFSHDTSFRANATAARFVENRADLGAFRGLGDPVRYNLFRGGLGFSQTVDDIRITGNIGAERRDYRDVTLKGGGVIDQDFRDVHVLSAGGSLQYDLRNGIGLIASGQYDRDRYDFRPGAAGFVRGVDLNRDSSGFTVQGGVTLELSRLVFGTIQAGYLRRRYVDPRLSNVGGFSYSADVLWNVTSLTSVRLRAARSIEDTSALQIAGNTRNDFRIAVDHELYRYIIVSADTGYGSFSPNGPGIGGREYTAGIGARYLINRRFSVNGGVRYSDRSSDSSFLRYHAASARIAVRYAL